MSYSGSKECHDTLSKPNQRFGNKFSYENLSILIEMNIEHDSSFQWIMHESISSTRRNASCVSTFYQSLSSLSRSVVPSTPTFARSTISALNLATSRGYLIKNTTKIRFFTLFICVFNETPPWIAFGMKKRGQFQRKSTAHYPSVVSCRLLYDQTPSFLHIMCRKTSIAAYKSQKNMQKARKKVMCFASLTVILCAVGARWCKSKISIAFRNHSANFYLLLTNSHKHGIISMLHKLKIKISGFLHGKGYYTFFSP